MSEGKIIYFIIVLITVLTTTAKDFVWSLYLGVDGYIQRFPGVLYSIFVLMTVPMLGFNLKFGAAGLFVLIIIEAIYITIYTLIYFSIKKIKEERRNTTINKMKEDLTEEEKEITRKPEVDVIVIENEEIQNESDKGERIYDRLGTNLDGRGCHRS